MGNSSKVILIMYAFKFLIMEKAKFQSYGESESTYEFYGGKNMSDLYVSDLDGTLLRSNERTSEYTNQVINSLVEKGMIFFYATARSLVTAKKVTKGINAKIPLIV